MTTIDLSGLPDPTHDPQFYIGVPYKRLLAWFIDLVIVGVAFFALIFVTLGLAAAILPVTLIAINLIYRIYTIKTYSATLGMRLAGIELRNNLGEKLTQKQAVWHTLAHMFFVMLLILQFVSMIMMLLNTRGQGLHDYILGTTAINRPVDH